MLVVKVGGSAGIDYEAVCADVAELVQAGRRLVLVHGGSQRTNEVATALGHPPQFVTSPSGYTSRYTDRPALEIFEMVYCGQINKGLVERLQRRDVNAVGLSGLDGRLWEGARKQAIRAVVNGRTRVIRGNLTGKVERVNTAFLHALLDAGYVPVLSPPAISYEGEAINVDGDRAAAATAVALQASNLLILTNVPGVLRDFPDENSLIAEIAPADIDRVAQTAAAGRMRIKLLGAQEALSGGVARVVLGDARGDRPLQRALAGEGTVFRHPQRAAKETRFAPTNSIQLEAQFTSGVYGKRPVALVRGQGAQVWDEDGRRYIDCTAGFGVANVGHSHPAVVAAVARQAQSLLTCPEFVHNDRRAVLLARLAAILPGGMNRIFLCNSGTEAVEGAIKFARLSTGRTGVVATMRGFHGRTLGALSATHKKEYREPFGPLVPGFSHVPLDNIERLEQAVTGDTAAVLIEVVQGEGGVRPASRGWLQAAQQICRQRGALLIVDEVQTGYGRTGRMFAVEHFDIEPDLLCLGKAMAGGVPMGAIGIGPRVAGLPVGAHGSTFGGNPLACAAAIAVLDIFEQEGLATLAAERGAYLQGQLRALNLPIVREVRGMGLMVGVELRRRVMPAVLALMDRGVLTLNAGPTTLRLLPPLVISQNELDEVVETIAAVLQAQTVAS